MKHKKVTRKLMTIVGALCLSLTILASPIASTPVQAAPPQDDAAMPLANFIEWRFKIEGRSLYKRLFNYSTSEWVGDWIYVGEVKFKGGGNN